MIEIIKTLLVSLSFAATGAGIAWSVTSDAKETFPSLITIESGSNQADKGDRLDTPSTKTDQLPTAASPVLAKTEASRIIFRVPL
jgi:hypothetical protein